MTIALGVNDHPQLQQSGGFGVYTPNPGYAAAMGATYVRIPVTWWGVQPTSAAPTGIATIVTIVQAYEVAGLKVILTPQDPPNWSNGVGGANGGAGQNVPPNSTAGTGTTTFATFMADMVAALPGRRWELFNEPDGNVYFLPNNQTAAQFLGGGATYAQRMAYYASYYVPLVQAAYTAMKAADPTCVVVAGAQSTLDPTFYQACITAGMLGYYDAYSPHIYGVPALSTTPDPTTAFGPQVTTLLAAQAAVGDTAPLWITETGWSAYSPTVAATHTPQNGPPTMVPPVLTASYGYASQANYTADFVAGLNNLGIPVVCVYQLLDSSATVAGTSADYQTFLGLYDYNGNPKPAATLLKTMVANNFAIPSRYANGGTHRSRSSRS